MRLNQFDYFRAVAILIIVAGHICMSDMISNKTLAENMIVTVMTGGTALFVFISGFFFNHIFYQRFNHQKFMVKKVKNVLIPYVFITSVIFGMYVIAQQFGAALQSTTPLGAVHINSWFDIFVSYGDYLMFGKISGPYWYIPFIMLIFIISPIFLAYIRLDLKMRLLINLFFIGISIFILELVLIVILFTTRFIFYHFIY